MIKKLIIIRYILFFISLILIFTNNWLFKNNLYIISTIVFFAYYIVSILFIRKRKLNNVKKYVGNNHIEDVGNYVYWNNESILLSDNYIFIIINDNIMHYKYNRIKKIESRVFPLSRGSSYYKTLTFDDNYVIEIHESSNSLNTKFSDISTFIKEKNSKVEINC